MARGYPDRAPFSTLCGRAFICGPERTWHGVSAQKTVTAVTTIEESLMEKMDEWAKVVGE